MDNQHVATQHDPDDPITCRFCGTRLERHQSAYHAGYYYWVDPKTDLSVCPQR